MSYRVPRPDGSRNGYVVVSERGPYRASATQRTVGERLIRNSPELTTDEIAIEVGVSSRTISRWKRALREKAS